MTQIALLSFPFLLAAAGISDMLTMKIPNILSAALVASFILAALLVGIPLTTIGWHIVAALAILAGSFVLFVFGWVGGGDAKLASAAALWLGPDQLFDYTLLAAALGGILTLLILAVRRFPLPKFVLKWPWIIRLHDSKVGVPYGAALAGAAMLLYPQSPLWLSFLTR